MAFRCRPVFLMGSGLHFFNFKCFSCITLIITVSGLAKVAIFTIPIAIGSVCGALNRHFCQTRVMPSLFFSSVQNLFAYAIH